MTRILFVVPPHIGYEAFAHPSYNQSTVTKSSGSCGSALTDMPLGLLAMSAYLKKHLPVETRLVDFNITLNRLERFSYPSFSGLFRDVLTQPEWAAFDPQVIGISALFAPSYRNVLELARCLRELFPSAVIVAGGGVPTNTYREIFRDSQDFDALCYGEGEKPLLSLVRAGDRLRHLEENPAWITRSKVERGATYQHDFIEDLDEIPFYDYGICSIEDYGLNPAIVAYAAVGEKQQNFHVMTSRGCTHRCCFCSSHTVHGRKMRYYSLARVREDFRRLRDEYGARILVFQDDHFMARKGRALEIVGIVKELGVHAVFQNSLALYALDRPVLAALRDAGVDQLPLAVESGSDRVLKKIMHKPLNLSIVKRVADDCRELGIYTNANILIGLPGETRQDIEDARAFLRTTHANWFIILIATPLVGSEMLEICIEKDYLRGSAIDCDYKRPIVETEEFTPEWIQEMAYVMNLDLNFVHNSDVALGDWRTALKGFENAIRAKADHALAHYYAAQCHERLGDSATAALHLARAQAGARDPFWRKYIEMFGLPL